jgi:hypothetical protein
MIFAISVSVGLFLSGLRLAFVGMYCLGRTVSSKTEAAIRRREAPALEREFRKGLVLSPLVFIFRCRALLICAAFVT